MTGGIADSLRHRLETALAAAGGEVPYPERLAADFPRILEQIAMLWGAPELNAYFDQLMTTTRTDREGFPEEVAQELFHLAGLHANLILPGSPRVNSWELAQEHDVLDKHRS